MSRRINSLINNSINYFYLSPILGQVTPESAEIIAAPKIALNLTLFDLEARKIQQQLSIDPLGHNPTSLTLSLKPHRTYELDWHARGPNQELVFVQTFTNRPPSKLVFLSCDYPLLDVRNSLWSRLIDQQSTFEDLNSLNQFNQMTIFHLGDNIYGDSSFHRSLRRLNQLPFDLSQIKYSPENYSQAGELVDHLYSQTYQETFSRWKSFCWGTNHLLFPDDHDITDNANQYRESEDPVERFTYQLARSLIDDYQKELFLNKNYNYNQGWFQRFRYPGDLGDTLIFVISRLDLGDQKYKESHLEELERQLNQNVCRALISFTGAPIPQAQGIYGRIYETIFGTDGLYSNEETLNLYKFCDRQLKKNPQLKLALIGGDLHISGQFTVRRKRREFKVLVSSPISNQSTPAEYIYAQGLRKIRRLDRFSIESRQIGCRRNYLSYKISPYSTGLKSLEELREEENPTDYDQIEIVKNPEIFPARLSNLWRAYKQLTGR